MSVMVLFDQHQDVVNVDFHLPNQLHLKHHIIGDVLFGFIVLFVAPFIPQILIAAKIILQITLRNQLVALEIIKGGQQVPHPQQCAKQHDKIFLVLLSYNLRICQREPVCQVVDHIGITLMVLSLLIRIAVIVVRIFAQQDNAACIFISKQRNCRIHPLLQVAEADDIAKGLDAVQDTVCPAERLNQTVHLQVFVHPKGVQGRGIEARQEHIDHDQQVKFFILHAERYIFIVILEPFAIGRVVRVEHLVVVLNGGIQKIPAALVKI